MNVKKVLKLVLIFCGVLVATNLFAQNNSTEKGKLFIIGGGARSNELLKKLVETANLQAKDYIVILPMASEEPDTAFKYINEQLQEVTDKKIFNLNFDSLSVKNPKMLTLLYGAKLIYISGGDQNRFMKTVLNTKVYDAIHFAYKNGSTIAGTSAGAAVMSKYMITGKQLKGDTTYKATFDKLWKDNIEFEEGLGLLDSVIIDQHFIKRSRYSRLLSALDAKPGFECIGIDESTALIVHGNTASVAGESQIIRFCNMQKDGLAEHKDLIKFKDVSLSLFTAGDIFLIK